MGFLCNGFFNCWGPSVGLFPILSQVSKFLTKVVQFFTALLVHSCYTVTTLIETSVIGFSSECEKLEHLFSLFIINIIMIIVKE